jgi:hypothetical protein
VKLATTKALSIKLDHTITAPPVSRLLFLAAMCVVLAASACKAESPPLGPEEACAKTCTLRATQCAPSECRRGCNLVLDRLLEHEASAVLACIEHEKAPCDDRAWARCASHVGIHADGGPPAPPPAPEFYEEQGE